MVTLHFYNSMHFYCNFIQFRFLYLLISDIREHWINQTEYPIIISSVKRSCKLYKQLQLLTHNNTTFFIFSHTGRYGSLGSYYLQYEFGEHETENRQNNKTKSSYAIQTLIR